MVSAVTLLINRLLVYISMRNIKAVSFLVFMYSCIQVYIISVFRFLSDIVSV